ncbi:aspartate/glutamate racemase family protein [Halobacteria archaeon AArc-m2/3/4]|uniref:Aspartate/glutamate racemase family protein n=1 Tax=Natronoglomus mannanivorans TaxID=2979990 RepID=A0ABT2QKJ1_9EURY|nr:aspartate/glutamate racemase family protein [Halobacteria archaeon AArc-m2/3/4]
MSTVCFFHTGSVLCEPFDELAAEYIPEGDYFHLVDESVIDELLSVGELTPSITRRICTQLSLAEQAGADVVLDTCSSTSPAVDTARQLVDVPIVKIDDPMAERAVELGDRIAVVATAESTLGPSTELVERKAEATGESASVESTLVDEAFEARLDGDTDRHDRLVSERVVGLAEETDVVILAQASMSHLESDLSDRVSVPVLSSPSLAMEAIANRVTE